MKFAMYALLKGVLLKEAGVKYLPALKIVSLILF